MTWPLIRVKSYVKGRLHTKIHFKGNSLLWRDFKRNRCDIPKAWHECTFKTARWPVRSSKAKQIKSCKFNCRINQKKQTKSCFYLRNAQWWSCICFKSELSSTFAFEASLHNRKARLINVPLHCSDKSSFCIVFAPKPWGQRQRWNYASCC